MSKKLEQYLEKIKKIEDDVRAKLTSVMSQAESDLEISDELDTESLRTNKLYAKYLNEYTNESITLKDFYTLKEKIKLERWKYYMGKQTEKYAMDNGTLHEKVLKTDIDKYLAADEKLCAINSLITVQKALVDYYEKIVKEISNRNFQLKVALDWRKFVSGVN